MSKGGGSKPGKSQKAASTSRVRVHNGKSAKAAIRGDDISRSGGASVSRAPKSGGVAPKSGGVAPKSGGVDDDLIDTTLEHLVQGHYFGTSQPSHQGDQTSLRKSRPTDFFCQWYHEKKQPEILRYFRNFQTFAPKKRID
jgi:hypothetical protein